MYYNFRTPPHMGSSVKSKSTPNMDSDSSDEKNTIPGNSFKLSAQPYPSETTYKACKIEQNQAKQFFDHNLKSYS